MTISIVLHVWNGERYLEALLDSVQAQTHDDFEVCVLDDGSTDRTPDILNNVASTDDRFRIQRQPAAGRARLDETFNRVVAMATHDLVAIANADDVWMPRKIERQVEVFARQPSLDICWHDAVVTNATGDWIRASLLAQPLVAPRTRMSPRDFISGNPIHNPTVMFKRRIMEQIGPQHYGWVHDAHFWLKAALARLEFLGLPERLIEYRVHEESHSTSSVRRAKVTTESLTMVADLIDRYGFDAFFPELDHADDRSSQAWAHAYLGCLAWQRGLTTQARAAWASSLAIEPNPAVEAAIADDSLMACAPAMVPWQGPLPPVASIVLGANGFTRNH